MAYRAPDHDRQYHFHITEHALERFRERVDEERRSLDDRALALLLDERLWDAYQSTVPKRYTEVVDRDRPGERTWIFEVESRAGRKNFVVMRRHHAGARPALPVLNGSIGCSLAAITVLTSEMASANYANGIWRVPDRRVAEKLAAAGITPAPPKPASSPAPSADSPPPAQSPAASAADKRPPSSLVERIQYAKQVLRERPHITALGKDGMRELVHERFGIGMSWETITRLREQVAEEQAAEKARGGMISPSSPYPTAVTNAGGFARTAVAKDRESSVAEQLTLAIAAEKKARAARAQAEDDLVAATTLVEKLMAALTASRE